MKNKVNFKHDCNECYFLGNDAFKGRIVDMYFCHQGGFPTLIMRFSDKGADYQSYPISVINSNLETFQETPFISNMLIAEDMGLWKRTKV